MTNYFKSLKKEDCNGCGVCELICPKKAITMVTDAEGFLYPTIDKTKCINCKLCEKKCPNIINKKNDYTKTYVSYLLNKVEKEKSSSGGMFYLLSSYIIRNNGVVFGVKYNDKMQAVHDYTKKIDDLYLFQGSKYVKSNLNGAYAKVEEFLKKGIMVLFSGTPCQCAGLRTYLNKTYDNLITCEIICHANPSPIVFEMYKSQLSKNNNNKKITNVLFRTKENGWKNQTSLIVFEDGSSIEDRTYYDAFVSELFNRPSCHNCKFSGSSRYSDFTIGDAWGIDRISPDLEDDDTGISLFCVNTSKAQSIFNKIKNDIYYKEVDTNFAFSFNHNHNIKPKKKKKKFFNHLNNGTINDNNIIESLNKYSKRSFLFMFINRIKRIIKFFWNIVMRRKNG